jgi:hypothetical protein
VREPRSQAPAFPRSQAPAWERTCRGGSPASRDGRRPEAGASGADAFPSWGLGTRKPLVFVSCICNNNSSYSQCVNLVPKPQLGNALVGEAPRLPVTGDGPKPGLLAQTRSQAGAWERGKNPP